MTTRGLSSDDTPTGRLTPAGMAGGSRARPAAPLDEPTMVVNRSDGPTALIAAVPQPPPVFVDPSGRRRSRLRWLAYVVGLLGLTYTGLVAVSFAGGMVEPHTVLPFLDEVEQSERPQSPQAEAITAIPEPSTAVPRTPAATVAPTVAPAPRSPAPTRSPSATRPASGDPAGVPTSPSPGRTTSVAPTPADSPSTEDPPPPPEETIDIEPGGSPTDGLPADG
ncbi:hypothetical protein OHQ88_31870 [Micromonospora zamorensis]|uniref:hypothetical protein n=1 Tax=Micromonospora zamorensis TaxID=709883 RepID=UPI002E240128|nr:hypothetical protein OG423_11495 [Micromonospora zamorensis]